MQQPAIQPGFMGLADMRRKHCRLAEQQVKMVSLAFSPPRPPMSFSARSSLTLHSWTSASSLFFLSVLLLSSLSMPASLSSSSCRFANY